MAEKGHQYQFPPCWSNARCVFGKETFAATCGNGRNAPIPQDRRGTALFGPLAEILAA